ncbi:MAG: TonB-dependent receptor [Tannerella sp.]|jgi:hypothetical protein|nr:TonB-dependent receptor [Tannerella sp.]
MMYSSVNIYRNLYPVKIKAVRVLISIFFGLILGVPVLEGQTFRLYGTVRDAQTGESLSGATVAIAGTASGTVTNAYGYYVLTLAAGGHEVQWSYLGYAGRVENVTVTADTLLDIELSPSATAIGEVTVMADRISRAPVVAGSDVSRLGIAEIRRIPALLGEPDALRSLQTLPGVQTSHHGSINMSVRGGSYSQNLVMLDEAPVFNPSHVLGFVSPFNPDAISTVDLYKGVPARYGSKLSSIVDIRMKEGSRERLGVSGSVGLLMSRLAVESPVAGGRGSILAAGRFCYAGLAGWGISELGNALGARTDEFPSGKSTRLWFYDLNLKGNYILDSKNRIYLSGYNGFDRFFVPEFSGAYLLEWGNLNGTLRWNHIVNPSLFVNTSLIASRFGYSNYIMNDGLAYRWDASLRQMELKSDAEHTPDSRLKLRYGLSLTSFGIRPGDISPRRSDSPVAPFSLQQEHSLETGLYAEADWEALPGLHLSGGVRLSTFSNIGPGTEYTFHPYNRLPVDSVSYGSGRFMRTFAHVNPRAAVRYLFGEGHTLKASYTNMVQYLHKASNSTLGMPTDIWFPASNAAPPQTAHQFSAGYSYAWGKGYSVSIEPYYKRMYHQIDFRDNADLFVNPYLAAEINSGEGESKGIELMLEKMQGKLTGRLSYTLSEATQQIEGVNEGRRYAAPYDSRHNLTAYTAFQAGEKLSVAASFRYATGRPVTIPAGTFDYLGTLFTTYTERNGYRIADFHELNLSFTWTPNPYRERYRGSWNLSIMNVYNRKNIFSIYSENVPGEMGTTLRQATKMYLYGILPMISYTFKW